MNLVRATLVLALLLHLIGNPALAQDSVFLEQLTWTEVRDGIRAGRTTVIIPTGGTEQNGPHIVLGKHNVRVTRNAGEIARRLGNALVAPTMAYVPEGNIDPPTGHMRFPGTITLPPEHFAKVIEFAARSLKLAGFTDIVLIGDSGPNQAPQKLVAEMLNREWAATPTRVHHLDRYYRGNAWHEWLVAQGLKVEGNHAHLTDTSLQLAVDPTGVRQTLMAAGQAGDGSGVNGDPTRATAALGKKGLEFIIDAAVKQLEELKTANRR
jgi:creatinine amidohydrolase/Fe(II)-dependent formamide hydrolase-like protein